MKKLVGQVSRVTSQNERKNVNNGSKPSTFSVVSFLYLFGSLFCSFSMTKKTYKDESWLVKSNITKSIRTETVLKKFKSLTDKVIVLPLLIH